MERVEPRKSADRGRQRPLQIVVVDGEADHAALVVGLHPVPGADRLVAAPEILLDPVRTAERLVEGEQGRALPVPQSGVRGLGQGGSLQRLLSGARGHSRDHQDRREQERSELELE